MEKGEGRGYEGVKWLRVSRVRGEEASPSPVGGREGHGGGRGGEEGKGTGVRGRREEGEEKGKDVATMA